MKLNSTFGEYPFTVRPLTAKDGGGFLIEYPGLPGCVSDGDTEEEAIRNGRDAVLSYLRSCVKHGDPVPRPGSLLGNNGCVGQQSPSPR